MRVLKVGLAVLFLAGSVVTVGGVVGSDSAEAKGKKDRPGKCGTLSFYNKKTKKCTSAVR